VAVALFVTCLADQLFPEVGVASVRLLRHVGVEVLFPEAQTCCGQPAYNAGHHAEALAIARHHLRVFEDAERVVLPSGSCASMVALHYAELLEADPALAAEARDLASRTVELSTFLLEVLGDRPLGADLAGTRVTLHDGCHGLRGLGISEAPRRLLERAGAELREADGHDTCCGFGGLFSVKMPEVSAAMARAKHAGIRAAGAEVLTSVDAACLMQLRGSLGREAGEAPRVLHLAELLWQGVERARA